MSTPLPAAAAALLDDTDWTMLHHADGPAVNCPPRWGDAIPDVPDMLRRLLHDDRAVRSRTLVIVDDTAFHQSSFYSVSPVVARYFTAILPAPHTLSVVDYNRRTRTLRATLISLLGAYADEAAWGEQHTPPRSYPDLDAFRALRPELYAAVVRYLDDPEPDIREAASRARIPLLKTPELTDERRAAAAEMRQVLTASTDRHERATAVQGLSAWNQDTAAYLADPDPAIRALAALTPSCTDNPDATQVLLDALADPAAADAWFTGPPRERLHRCDAVTLFNALAERTESFEALLAPALAVLPLLDGPVSLAGCWPGLPRVVLLAFPDGVPEHEHELSANQRTLVENLAASRVWITGPTRDALPLVDPQQNPHALNEVRLREHIDRRRE